MKVMHYPIFVVCAYFVPLETIFVNVENLATPILRSEYLLFFSSFRFGDFLLLLLMSLGCGLLHSMSLFKLFMTM